MTAMRDFNVSTGLNAAHRVVGAQWATLLDPFASLGSRYRPNAHINDSNHGTGDVLLAQQRIWSRVSACNQFRSAPERGRPNKPNLVPSTTWPCRFSAPGQMPIIISSNNSSPMPLVSPLALDNQHNLRQASSSLLRTKKPR